MRRRLEGFERRLACLTAVLRGWARTGEAERERRERHVLLASMLRGALVHAGLDPDQAVSLQRLEEPEPPPPAVHPLRRLAERQRPRPLIEILFDLTRRYHASPAPDLRQASVMQLIGYYCFGEGAARDAPA
ncbi:MAG TPA: hypothetical protein VMI30_04045 [Stellaceae bacterium]|nr:hypothetical protein [Stellaceae bacterium]